MTKIISLVEMRVNEIGKIVEIQGGHGMAQRLETLGVRTGKEAKKLSGQFMRGPILIQAGNTQVGIGFGMARRVLVEVDKNA